MATLLDTLLGTRIRQLRPPLAPEMLQPLHAACEFVQFDTAFAEHEYMALGRFLGTYPRVTLRVFGRPGLRDLSFLRHFPRLRRFHADLWELERLEGLELLSGDLEYLGLGQTKRRQSLSPLSRFGSLRELYLEGHTRDIDVLLTLGQVEKVTLRSITLPDLHVLSAFTALLSLDIKLGGTKSLGELPRFTQLKYLELWRILGLDDLSFLSDLASLQYLFLEALPRVAQLPDVSGLSNLRKVHLQSLRGLSDLTPIAHVPNLRELVVLQMPQLAASAFEPFVGHSALRAATVGLRNARLNEQVKALLGLPPAGGKAHFEFN